MIQVPVGLAKLAGTLALATALLTVDLPVDGWIWPEVVPDAQARVGRPGTPLSFAGVARRTTRRVIYRSTVYARTLPQDCVQTNVNGTLLYQCGATLYQPVNGQYNVVQVQ